MQAIARSFNWIVQNDHTLLDYQIIILHNKPSHQHFTGSN